MSINSSSSPLNDFHYCMDATGGASIITAYLITKVILFLPVSVLVLYLGFRRWRKQRSFTTSSHSDIFTYNSVAHELIYLLGTSLYFCGKFTGVMELMRMGYYLCSTFIPAQIAFHILTCLERYLAVAQPIIYLGLKQSGGVRIRNISIGCVWLLCFGWIPLAALYSPNVPFIPYFCLLVFALVVVSSCSLSVLYVLRNPGPGEMGKGREVVDQSKHRAFHTITAITGMLWLFFIGFLVCVAMESSHLLKSSDGCLAMLFGHWIALPSNLVLPFLFLHRKLLCSSEKK